MNNDKNMELDFSDIKLIPDLNRRDFIKTIGGGIIILFWLGDDSLLAAEAGRGRGYPEDFNAYLKISAEGRVTCFTGKIEMGQGIVTSLAQMLAEELDVSLDSVDMVMGDTSVCPWDMGTFGSMSTRFFGPPLRNAGAVARSVLIGMAAERLGIGPDNLATENGAVFEKDNKDKRVTYAQLAEGKTITKLATQKPNLKKSSEFKVIGKDVLRRDATDKVTGKAKYAGDIQLPGMLYARLVRPPSHGAKLTNADTSAAEKVEGATVIKDGDIIAVLHKDWDVAGNALERIKADFEEQEPKADNETIFDYLVANAKQKSGVDKGGDLEEGAKLGEIVVEQTYLNDYVAHAPIETHTAVAQVEGNKATVWVSTQGPFTIRDQIAQAINFKPEDVRVIAPFVGGGFGGKSSGRQAIEASRLSKISGKPVQVMWTRQEEFFYDTFRPAAVIKIKSAITKAGKIVLWDYAVYCAGDRGAKHFYDIPNHRTESFGGAIYGGGPTIHPFAVGAWRAPGNNTNTFARECQIDIMASKAGMDPVEFRLANLKDQRMIRVLKTVAEKFGFKGAKSPSGRGLGVACGTDSGTYVAMIAEVEADKKSGSVKVKRVVCAQDMGLVINPEGAKIQMEGCITMGLGYALTEGMHFKGGKIIDLTFESYELPRFSWVPKIETILIKDDNAPAQGGGEPAIVCMGAVIANAVYDATGARVLRLPLRPEHIRKAVADRRSGVKEKIAIT